MAITDALAQIRVCLTMGIPWAPPDPKRVVDVLRRFHKWDASIQALINEATELQIPLLVAEAIRTRLIVHSSALWSLRFASRFLQIGAEPDSRVLEILKAQAVRGIDIFSQASNVAGMLQVKIHLAHVHELVDDLDEAKAIAREVLPLARAYGIKPVEEEALALLSGTTLLQQCEAGMTDRHEGDQDVAASQMSDEDIDAYARRTLAFMGLPQERVLYARRDLEGMRRVARERLHWCRHIQLIQDLRHTFDKSTAYALPQTFIAKCERHGYESVVGAHDYNAVLDRFKTSMCSGCPDRKPKVA